MIRLVEWWINRPTPEELKRIEAEIRDTAIDLTRRASDPKEAWETAASCELDKAEECLKKRPVSRAEFESAWTALKAATRTIMHSFNATELAEAAITTRSEASAKLHGWRLTSVRELIGSKAIANGELHQRVERIERTLVIRPESDDTLADRVERAETNLPCSRAEVEEGTDLPEGKDPPQPEAQDCGSEGLAGCVDVLERRLGIGLRDGVIASRKILDEHADNMYRKLALLRDSVFRTSLILLLALLALTLLVWRRWATIVVPDEDAGDGNLILENWKLLVVVMVLGSLGALVSAATNLRERDRKIRVPDQLTGNALMAMRPLVGAASAVVVLVVLQSGLSNDLTVNGSAVFAVAVAAGFAERLVTRVVDSAVAGAGS